MDNKKQQIAKTTRKYTHPEFLKEYFPNLDSSEFERKDEGTLTQELFFDILTNVTSPKPQPSSKEMS